jgi:hypothetical protein
MITLSQFTELLGWTAILNLGFLLFASIILIALKPQITSIHSKLFAVPKAELTLIYFNYLAKYKALTFIFIVAPYFSLKIMAQ